MHPLLQLRTGIVQMALLVGSIVFIQWLLLTGYGDESAFSALVDSVVSVFVFAFLCFIAWDVIRVIRSVYFLVVLSIAILLVWLLVIQSVWWLFSGADPVGYESYVYSVPLRLFIGLLVWCIVLLWYRLIISKTETQSKPISDADNAVMTGELCDHVAVKDGTRIHIVRLDDLVAIQAEGDYVILITSDARFVKEQTMKYFEFHLPPNRFVRIHRSHIVNVEQILRVELYGKETYHVLLKNGVCLKASSNGYKLLKERLAL